MFQYVSARPVVQADPAGLGVGPDFGCCGPCACESLNVSDVGWRILNLGSNWFGYSGFSLSYIWTANGTWKGNRECGIDTTVTGTESYWSENGGIGVDPSDVNMVYPPILRTYLSDGGCGLPLFTESYTNALNCASKWSKCAGTACYLDGPGIPLSWFKKPAKKFCVSLNLVFTIKCKTQIGGPGITKTLSINSTKCISATKTNSWPQSAKKSDFCGIGTSSHGF